jgi:hypothetical protein
MAITEQERSEEPYRPKPKEEVGDSAFFTASNYGRKKLVESAVVLVAGAQCAFDQLRLHRVGERR